MSTLEMLRAALRTGTPDGIPLERPRDTCGGAYAVWRFLAAWRDAATQGGSLGADHAVLLRQVARWHAAEPYVDAVPPAFAPLLARAGVSVSPVGTLRAHPFAPEWLKEAQIDQEAGLDAPPARRRPDESVPGEAYLTSLRYSTWHSQAQKEAAWATITAPPRTSTLVALPTGAGKSLCFQLAARFSDGLTVVVVPTVALAIDHWQSARAVFAEYPGVNPEYFAADDPTRDPREVLERVERRECRLLFTSPESCVSGRFRALLAACAADGWLENLVVDEAHLVDTWGVYFRVDFQLLSALRRQWLAHPTARVRTLLLSATFTPTCRGILRRLFCEEGTPWREFLSQRLRPEMTYYTQRLRTAAERAEAVVDAVWHLPRPAIVYTTTREDAVAVAARLREEGFARIGCFHGDTPGDERRRLLEDWRADRLDLMVATSAFGMGVDKADVRAVVHACLPEDLHRYYQEVGRGGRDGCSAVCLLLVADDTDVALARGLAPRLMRPDTLQGRWQALWASAVPVGGTSVSRRVAGGTSAGGMGAGDTYAVRLDAKPANLRGSRTGARNVAWNKRLLLQLVRAGELDLLDIRLWPADQGPVAGPDAAPARDAVDDASTPLRSAAGVERPVDVGLTAFTTFDVDDFDDVNDDADAEEMGVASGRPTSRAPAHGAPINGAPARTAGPTSDAESAASVEWAVVRLRFTPSSTEIARLIEEVRAQELAVMGRGLELMLSAVDGARCVSHALTELYGPTTVRACGGCPACRRAGRRPRCVPLAVPLPVDTDARQVVVADVPSLRSPATHRDFITFLRRVLRERGLRRFLCASERAPLVRQLLGAAVDPRDPTYYRVDVVDGSIPFVVGPHECLAVLHTGAVIGAGLRVRRGAAVYHLITADTPYLDENDRFPLEADGSRFYPTPAQWFQET